MRDKEYIFLVLRDNEEWSAAPHTSFLIDVQNSVQLRDPSLLVSMICKDKVIMHRLRAPSYQHGCEGVTALSQCLEWAKVC